MLSYTKWIYYTCISCMHIWYRIYILLNTKIMYTKNILLYKVH